MIAFLLALLLWMLGGGPTPTPSVDAVHAASAPAPAAHGGNRGPSSPSPAGRRSGGVSHLPQPPATPTVAEPTNGAELQTVMCTDPIDCPPGQ